MFLIFTNVVHVWITLSWYGMGIFVKTVTVYFYLQGLYGVLLGVWGAAQIVLRSTKYIL
jgi:hypothetical protein